MTFPRRWVALALLSTLPMFATAKPIAFAKGKTLMLEYGAGTMNEVQLFYAPRYWASVGGGWPATRASRMLCGLRSAACNSWEDIPESGTFARRDQHEPV